MMDQVSAGDGEHGGHGGNQDSKEEGIVVGICSSLLYTIKTHPSMQPVTYLDMVYGAATHVVVI